MAVDGRNIRTTGHWVRASRCGPPGNCVEFRRDTTGTAVRDSKGEVTAILRFGSTSWASFLEYCGSMCGVAPH